MATTNTQSDRDSSAMQKAARLASSSCSSGSWGFIPGITQNFEDMKFALSRERRVDEPRMARA